MSSEQEGDRPARDDPGSGGDATDEADASATGSGENRPALPAPRPDRSPENVVRTVLSALATNDDPFEDAGIRTAFAFAAPSYRARVGGSLAALRDRLTDPVHRALVDHREARPGPFGADDGRAEGTVVVVDEDGEEFTYEFALEEPTGGKYEGCWMVAGIDLVYLGAAPDHRHVPVVEFDGVEVGCEEGEVLRDALLRASGVSPHNSAANYANCNGRGLCGTCAVEVVEGEVTGKTAQERRRLRLPPHDEDGPGYRLSCQARVLSDLVVRKHEGLWGQHVTEYAEGTGEDPDADPIRVTEAEFRGTDEGTAGEDVPTGEADPSSRGELDLSDETRAALEAARQRLESAEDGEQTGIGDGGERTATGDGGE